MTILLFQALYHIAVKILMKAQVYNVREREYSNKISRELKKFGINGVVLDIGCGQGNITRRVARKARFTLVGLDINRVSLKAASKHGILCIVGDAEKTPLRNECIDAVIAISLLEHLPKPAEHVKELARALKLHGVAIIQVPNLRYPIEPHTKWPLLFLFPNKIQSLIQRAINYDLYINMNVTQKFIINSFKSEGFREIKSERLYFLKMQKLCPVAPAYLHVALKV